MPNRLFLGTTHAANCRCFKDKTLPGSTIFVCVEKTCQLPVTTVNEALKQFR